MKKQELKKDQKPLSFQALKAEWYAKLADSGWVDIEQPDERLKRWTCRDFVQPYFTGVSFDAKIRYFELAADLLKQPQVFETPQHLQIWSLHAAGESVRTIGKHISASKSYVHTIVSRYKPLIVPDKD